MYSGAFGEELSFTEKACPRCGAILFADMNTCYSCLYDFKRAMEEIPPDIPTFSEQASYSGDLDSEVHTQNTLPWDAITTDVYYPDEHGRMEDVALQELPRTPDTWDRGLPPSWFENDPDAQDDFDEFSQCKQAETNQLPLLQLVVQSSDMRCVVPLERELIVGRHPSSHICLSSAAISKRHISIKPMGQCVEVKDLGAKNAARYHGRDIKGVIHIRRGDSLTVCGTVIKLI